MIAALPPVLPSQQQVLLNLMQDSWADRNRLVIDPDARVSKLWDALVLAVLLFNAASVPFRVAFAPAPREIDALWAIGFGCDALLALDAIVCLNRGYHEQGHKEMDARAIRRRFACTLISSSHATLFVCVLALAPIDLLELLPATLASVSLRGGLRANRLLLTPRAFMLLRELAEPRLGRQRVLLLRLVLLFALLVHSVGCLWCAPRDRIAPRSRVHSHARARIRKPGRLCRAALAASPPSSPHPSQPCADAITHPGPSGGVFAGMLWGCATASAPTRGCRRRGSRQDRRPLWEWHTSAVSTGRSA